MSGLRCDSHIHVVGSPARYPQLADRTYLAGPAPLAAVEKAAAPRAVSRFVVVQPSFYGTDNTLLLEALDALAGRGRGVAVADREAAAAFRAWSARGVRGLRINLYSPLGPVAPLAERFGEIESLAAGAGWHVEVIAPLKMLAENAAMLAGAKVPVVIDHYGLHGGVAPEQAAGKALLDLLRRPHVWMKLSAPYRNGADALATKPDPAWLAAILAAAADRCVWGSDWPHTPPHEAQHGPEHAAPYRALRYEALVDDFIAAVGSAERAERILTDNPARLYGFPS